MLIQRRQRGFNLVEAIITLAVLGILVAAAVPSVTDWMRSTAVRNLAETTNTGLQKARMEAMRRNQIVTFWMVTATSAPTNDCALSAASAAWVVSLDNPAGKCATAPSATETPRIVEVYGPGPSVAGITVSGLDQDAAAASSVSFNGFGQAVRTGKPLRSIDISHTDISARRLRLQIAGGGGIRMCDRDVTSPDPRACN
ncbi:MAG: pilus assembly protein FimT [Ramlibacter sp.]|uniref:GspH/FimT family pseudopilin n=1 Tax=Ramlibacter sp. TaxID=1917967 RepID=UPI002607A2AC|nr:GspH/FimT family pseudopilin [Ramlibacter sp.]MDB5753334.1 pilus assembly protein FimT [Ramlibacter sp.]